MQFLKPAPKLVDVDGTSFAAKPLSRQSSVQSTKSVNSVITSAEVPENQSSAVGVTTPVDSSLNRTPSVVKRDSNISRSSTGGISDQEPLIEQSETTELLSEL